jgi:hypothetical protein
MRMGITQFFRLSLSLSLSLSLGLVFVLWRV